MRLRQCRYRRPIQRLERNPPSGPYGVPRGPIDGTGGVCVLRSSSAQNAAAGAGELSRSKKFELEHGRRPPRRSAGGCGMGELPRRGGHGGRSGASYGSRRKL